MHGPRDKMKTEQSKDFFGSIKRIFKELSNYRVLLILSLFLSAMGAVLTIILPGKLSNLTNLISVGITPNSNNISTIISNTYNINIDTEKVSNDYRLSEEEKNILINHKAIDVHSLDNLSDIAYEYIYPFYEIDGVIINSKDQKDFIKLLSSVDKNNQSEIIGVLDKAPESIKKVTYPKMDMNGIFRAAMILGGLLIISMLFLYITSIMTAYISNYSARDLRERISLKINRLPLRYFDNNQIGDLLSRVTNDIDTIAMSLNTSLATLVTSLTTFIGAIVMMFVTNYIMAITAILSTILGFVLMFIILGKSQKYFSLRQKELGKLNSHIEEVYSRLLVVKAYNGKKQSSKKFDELNNNVYTANMMSQFLSGLMQPLMGFIGNFGYVAVCIVGAILALNGEIMFGVIVAFMIYIRLFTNPLSQIAQAFTSLQSTAAAGERVFEFLDEEEMDNEYEITNVLYKDDIKGDIKFKNVKFGYDKNETIIKDFSQDIKAGSKIAIVGPTGAGKTTMVNLLMKFYDIDSGDITIDGVSIKDMTRDNIHSLFTMVLQDTWLFDGTIKENIVFNKDDISDDRVNEVLNIVGLKHFIETLPNGINSNINESDNISSGQKQLLTIARGMLEDAPLLILDEATSNVDTRTEELVQKAMDKLTKGRTSFIIAHRLSTIKNADLILVMNDGNIVESGTHKELLKKNGFYANLYNSQFEL